MAPPPQESLPSDIPTSQIPLDLSLSAPVFDFSTQNESVSSSSSGTKFKPFDPSPPLLPHRHLPLDLLRSSLRQHLNGLKKKLEETVDGEWEELVRVGVGVGRGMDVKLGGSGRSIGGGIRVDGLEEEEEEEEEGDRDDDTETSSSYESDSGTESVIIEGNTREIDGEVVDEEGTVIGVTAPTPLGGEGEENPNASLGGGGIVRQIRLGVEEVYTKVRIIRGSSNDTSSAKIKSKPSSAYSHSLTTTTSHLSHLLLLRRRVRERKAFLRNLAALGGGSGEDDDPTGTTLGNTSDDGGGIGRLERMVRDEKGRVLVLPRKNKGRSNSRTDNSNGIGLGLSGMGGSNRGSFSSQTRGDGETASTRPISNSLDSALADGDLETNELESNEQLELELELEGHRKSLRLERLVAEHSRLEYLVRKAEEGGRKVVRKEREMERDLGRIRGEAEGEEGDGGLGNGGLNGNVEVGVDEEEEFEFVKGLRERLASIANDITSELASLLSLLLDTPPIPSRPESSLFPPTPNSTSFLKPSPRPELGINGRPSQHGPSIAERTKARQDALAECLRAFQTMGKVKEAEDVLRERVKDFVLKNVHREALLGPQSPMAPATPFTPMITRGFAGGSSPDGSAPPFSLSDSLNFYSQEPLQLPRPQTSSNEDDIHAEAICQLYNKILLYVSKECGPVLDVAERKLGGTEKDRGLLTQGNLSGSGDQTPTTGSGGKGKELATTIATAMGQHPYFLLANVVWDEIGKRLMNELGAVIWAPGRPEVFHRNYLLTSSFVSRFENMCPTLRHLTHLRNHPTYLNFQRRWQLPVYFQLRFKETVVNLESGIDEGPAPPNEWEFRLKGTLAVYQGVRHCWDTDIFLPDLVHKFWRLSLQLLSRYRSWLDETLPEYTPSTQQTAPSRSSVDSPKGTPARPSTPVQQRGEASKAVQDDAKDDVALRHYCLVIADTVHLEKAMNELWRHDILPKMPKGEFQECQGVLKQSLSKALAVLPPLESNIILIISRRCSDSLKHVARMPTQVRSLRKAPTEPSHFVPGLTRPLKTFLDGDARSCPSDRRKDWAKAILEDIVSRYVSALITMRRTDDSLRRLKRGKQQNTGFFGFRQAQTPQQDATEEDRVRAQMALDVDALQIVIEGLGVGLQANEEDIIGWESLKAVAEGIGEV